MIGVALFHNRVLLLPVERKKKDYKVENKHMTGIAPFHKQALFGEYNNRDRDEVEEDKQA